MPGLLTLLALFASADLRTARDNIRHDGFASHRSQELTRLLSLLARFARADICTARDIIQHDGAQEIQGLVALLPLLARTDGCLQALLALLARTEGCTVRDRVRHDSLVLQCPTRELGPASTADPLSARTDGRPVRD